MLASFGWVEDELAGCLRRAASFRSRRQIPEAEYVEYRRIAIDHKFTYSYLDDRSESSDSCDSSDSCNECGGAQERQKT